MAWMNYLQTYLIANEKHEGQGMVEYGLIIALVSIVAAAVLLTLGGDVKGIFEGASEKLTSGTSTD